MSAKVESVQESARQVPVLRECDVLVAGGGVSGCAAAVSAARAGAKTVLLERNGILGGVATASLMGSFCNMFVTKDGRTVLRGFAGEVTDRLVRDGAASPHAKHPEVPGFPFDCERFKVLLIEMCAEAGVEVLTHALAARPICDGRKVRGCFVESKSGRQAILAGNTVDCTGEADLVWQTGVEMEQADGSASTLFQMGPVDVDALVDFIESDAPNFPKNVDCVRDAKQVAENWRERGVLFLPHGGGVKWEFVQRAVRDGEFVNRIGDSYDLDALGMYGFRGNDAVYVNSNFNRPKGVDVVRLSSYELEAQKLAYHVGDFLTHKMPGFQKARVTNIGAGLGYRASRKIIGRKRMLKAWLNGSSPVLHDDVIGRTLAAAVSHIDPEKEKLNPSCASDLPFGVLVPVALDNILVGSGKSVSQEQFILRNMPKCMTCGQAAGVAAALASKAGISASEVDIRSLQQALLQQGVDLGDAERLAKLGLRSA